MFFSSKFGDSYRNLLGIKCTKLYSDTFKFDIFIAQCLGGQFLLDAVHECAKGQKMALYNILTHKSNRHIKHLQLTVYLLLSIYCLSSGKHEILSRRT